MSDDICFKFSQLHVSTKFTITFNGVKNHIEDNRVRQLDRIARFYPNGYTTTTKNSH